MIVRRGLSRRAVRPHADVGSGLRGRPRLQPRFPRCRKTNALPPPDPPPPPTEIQPPPPAARALRRGRAPKVSICRAALRRASSGQEAGGAAPASARRPILLPAASHEVNISCEETRHRRSDCGRDERRATVHASRPAATAVASSRKAQAMSCSCVPVPRASSRPSSSRTTSTSLEVSARRSPPGETATAPMGPDRRAREALCRWSRREVGRPRRGARRSPTRARADRCPRARAPTSGARRRALGSRHLGGRPPPPATRRLGRRWPLLKGAVLPEFSRPPCRRRGGPRSTRRRRVGVRDGEGRGLPHPRKTGREGSSGLLGSRTTMASRSPRKSRAPSDRARTPSARRHAFPS